MPIIAFTSAAKRINKILFARWSYLRPLLQFNNHNIFIPVLIITANQKINPVTRLD